MRAPILGVLLGDNLEQLKSYVTAATIITHTDPKALDGALLTAIAAHCSAITHGNITPSEFLQRITELQKCGIISSAAKDLVLPVIKNHVKDPLQFRTEVLGPHDGVTGFSNHTVQMALHLWLKYPKNYETTVISSIQCGGDTDTLTAIVGGIVGAATGTKSIPESWQSNLWEFPRSLKWMQSLAGALAEKNDPRFNSKLSLNPSALLIRNLLFLVIILAHGFRRLAPPY